MPRSWIFTIFISWDIKPVHPDFHNVLASSHTPQHSFLFVLLMTVFGEVGVGRDLNAFRICISLIASEVKHSFPCFLVVCLLKTACSFHEPIHSVLFLAITIVRLVA